MREIAGRLRVPRLSAKSRLFALITAVIVVGVASTGSYLLLRNANVPLFARPLLPDQTAEVESRLNAWNVPYVERDGQISVESPRRNELALRLSLQGIPHQHLATTSETLSNVGAMTPQSVLDVQTREGLAADLALGVRSIEGVRDARVIVAPASTGLFADEPAQTTKASVRVSLDPGAILSKATVAGIKSFVADGVPGLVAQNVAVMDDRGLALNGDAQDTEHDQRALEISLQSALDATIGAGLTLVRVNVQTDPESVHRHEIRRAPVSGGVIADRTIREQYKTAGKSYAKTHASVDRGTDTIDSETRVDAGRTKRVSVAVFVDRSRAADIASVTALVTAAAGLDRARGDTLEVAAMSFARPERPKGLGLRRTAFEELLPAVPGMLVTLAVVVSLAVFARPITGMFETMARRYTVETTQRLPAGTFTPSELHALLASEPPHTAAIVLSRLPSAQAAEVLELFSSQARRDIVERMSRTISPIVADIGSGVTSGVVEDASR